MVRGRSSIGYILEALLPYSDANFRLIYRRRQFFNDLEKTSHYKNRTLQNAFYRLTKQGFIEFDNDTPGLTEKGRANLQLYRPEKIKNAYLMVIFDIPECDRTKRQQLRVLLRELKFVQAQKSVWLSQYETRDYLKAEIKHLKLEGCVQVFESHQLNL